jgi:hypothetical protein
METIERGEYREFYICNKTGEDLLNHIPFQKGIKKQMNVQPEIYLGTIQSSQDALHRVPSR